MTTISLNHLEVTFWDILIKYMPRLRPFWRLLAWLLKTWRNARRLILSLAWAPVGLVAGILLGLVFSF
jgi:hypothetical protein